MTALLVIAIAIVAVVVVVLVMVLREAWPSRGVWAEEDRAAGVDARRDKGENSWF